MVVRACSAAMFVVAALGVFEPSAVDAQRRRNHKPTPKLSAPKRIVLGADQSAVIQLSNAGTAVDFYANVGRIVSTKINEKGHAEAIYEPPAGRYPQVAIVVAASADQVVLEWVAIPLYTQPDILIQSIPRADVVAHIAGQDFGPVRTDGKGHARLQVVVPPGLQSVPLSTTNRLGSISKSSTALDAPPFGRILALCPSGDADDVLFFATGDDGSALSEAAFKIKSGIALGETRKLRAGVYAAQIPVAGATESQAFSVTASLAGHPKFTSACTGERPGTLPSAMRVRLSSQSYTAGTGSPIEVTVELDYEQEERRRRPRLLLESSIGSLSAPSRRSDTEFVATWDIPDDFTGNAGATLSASSVGQAELDLVAKIQLKAGPPSTLALQARGGVLPADGSSTTEVEATLKDAYGNAVIGATLEGQGASTLGVFAPALSPGHYVATYTARRSYSAQSERFSVRESGSGIEGTLSVALVPIKRRFVTDLRLGYTTNLGIVKAPSGTLAAAYRLPVGEHYALLGVHLSLYRSSSDLIADDGGALDLNLLGMPLFASLGYERVFRSFSAYVGAGGGTVYSRTKLNSMSTGSRALSQYSFGGGAFVGGRLPIGPGHLVSQASYWLAKIDHAGVSGNLLGLGLELGYGFDL